MAIQCIRAMISGRVQGVFFRDSTSNEARKLDITGYAKNLTDGQVEVLACGQYDKMVYFINWLNHGPEHARVDDVIIEEINIPVPTGFHIR